MEAKAKSGGGEFMGRVERGRGREEQKINKSGGKWAKKIPQKGYVI